MLGSLVRGAKDGALAMSMKAFLNDKLGLYGEIVDCSVDTKSNKVTLKASKARYHRLLRVWLEAK